MLVNNKNAKLLYKATESKKLISPAYLEITKERFNNFYQVLSKTKHFKSITVKLLFEGTNRDIINTNISNFLTNFTDEADIKFDNLSNFYHVYLDSHEVEDTEFDEWLYLNLNLVGYEYGPEVTVNINRILTQNINVLGNEETPVWIEITPSLAVANLTISGLTEIPLEIKTLGANKKLIIKDGLITVDGVNAADIITFWEFPRLMPGTNTITLNKNTCDVQLKYNPRYL